MECGTVIAPIVATAVILGRVNCVMKFSTARIATAAVSHRISRTAVKVCSAKIASAANTVTAA